MAYGLLIMTGQYTMQNRESWNWRRVMAFWNLGLSVFSWIGMARTLPQLLHNLYYMSVRDNLCTDRKSALCFVCDEFLLTRKCLNEERIS
jgi:elongation of very long chain fatty acids protein 6